MPKKEFIFLTAEENVSITNVRSYSRDSNFSILIEITYWDDISKLGGRKNIEEEERRERERGRFHKERGHKGIASIVTDRTESWYT